MKRMMKSKILATALCATVMAGIYASPVMAENKSALEQEKNARIVGDTALEKKINGEP